MIDVSQICEKTEGSVSIVSALLQDDRLEPSVKESLSLFASHPFVQGPSVFELWPDYNPLTDITYLSDGSFQFMRTISYPLLFPLLGFLIFFGPPIIGRYMWVMLWNPSAWPIFFEVIFQIYGCQLASIWNAAVTIIYTPFVIGWKYVLLTIDFL